MILVPSLLPLHEVIDHVVVEANPPSYDHDLSIEDVHRDAIGRVTIQPLGQGYIYHVISILVHYPKLMLNIFVELLFYRWTPNHHVIEVIGHVISSQLRGSY